MIGSHQCTITSVSQRCNNQSCTVSKILEEIHKFGVDHLDRHRIFRVSFMVPVVTKLSNPTEILYISTVFIYQGLNHIFVVDINCYQGSQSQSIKLAQISSYQSNNIFEFTDEFSNVALH